MFQIFRRTKKWQFDMIQRQRWYTILKRISTSGLKKNPSFLAQLSGHVHFYGCTGPFGGPNGYLPFSAIYPNGLLKISSKIFVQDILMNQSCSFSTDASEHLLGFSPILLFSISSRSQPVFLPKDTFRNYSGDFSKHLGISQIFLINFMYKNYFKDASRAL